MVCPRCGSATLRVVDSRDAGPAVRRRRRCEACGERFTTYEEIRLPPLFVRKRDGSRQPFKRSKILRLVKRLVAERPVPPGVAGRLATAIAHRLAGEPGGEVPSRRIAGLLIELLAVHDEPAARRLAVWYEDDRAVAPAPAAAPPPRQLWFAFAAPRAR